MPDSSSTVLSPVASVHPKPRPRVSDVSLRKLGQVVIGGLVFLYLAVVLVAPLGAMAVELAKLGPWTALKTLIAERAASAQA